MENVLFLKWKGCFYSLKSCYCPVMILNVHLYLAHTVEQRPRGRRDCESLVSHKFTVNSHPDAWPLIPHYLARLLKLCERCVGRSCWGSVLWEKCRENAALPHKLLSSLNNGPPWGAPTSSKLRTAHTRRHAQESATACRADRGAVPYLGGRSHYYRTEKMYYILL